MPVARTVAPPVAAKPQKVVIEKVIHERSLGLTFREVEGMLQKLRSSIVQEFEARIKQEPRDLPCDVPAIAPLLQEQQASNKADMDAALQRQEAAFQEMRSGLLQEVTTKLQQTCGLLL